MVHVRLDTETFSGRDMSEIGLLRASTVLTLGRALARCFVCAVECDSRAKHVLADVRALSRFH